MEFCLNNRIELLFLPPHSSHVLQPLDLTIFGPLKVKYHKEISKFVSLDISNIKRPQFIQAYQKARAVAMNKSNIEAGWRISGFYPYNPQIPLSSPFVKDLTADESLVATQNTLKLDSRLRGGAVDLSERSARQIIREQASKIEALQAENALLKAQIKTYREREESKKPEKRKKVVSSSDSNAKLISIQDILHTQELQDLKEKEDQATKERRAKKAKTKALKAQKATD